MDALKTLRSRIQQIWAKTRGDRGSMCPGYRIERDATTGRSRDSVITTSVAGTYGETVE